MRLPTDFSTAVGQTHSSQRAKSGPTTALRSSRRSRPTRDGQTDVNPAAVRKGPIAAALEWRLVTISGLGRGAPSRRRRVACRGRAGEWIGPSGRLERSGIDSTALVEGRRRDDRGRRQARLSDGVRPAFAVVPRTARRTSSLGPAQATTRAGSSDPQPGDPAIQASRTPRIHVEQIPVWPESAEPGQSTDRLSSPIRHRATCVASLRLPIWPGTLVERVSIGGFVTAIDGARLTVQDESAAAVVRLYGDALSTLELISSATSSTCMAYPIGTRPVASRSACRTHRT